MKNRKKDSIDDWIINTAFHCLLWITLASIALTVISVVAVIGSW